MLCAHSVSENIELCNGPYFHFAAGVKDVGIGPISGVQNWRGKIGKINRPDGSKEDVSGPIPDLDRVAWTGRAVSVLFDRDAHTNESVKIARNSIAKELRSEE